MSYDVTLKNFNGNQINPRTKASCVYLDESTTVEDKLNQLGNGGTKIINITPSRNLLNIDWTEPDYYYEGMKHAQNTSKYATDHLEISNIYSGFKIKWVDVYYGSDSGAIYKAWYKIPNFDIYNYAGRTLYGFVNRELDVDVEKAWKYNSLIFLCLYNPSDGTYETLFNMLDETTVNATIPDIAYMKAKGFTELAVCVDIHDYTYMYGNIGDTWTFSYIQVELDESTEYIVPNPNAEILDTIYIESELSEESNNLITNSAVTTEINNIYQTVASGKEIVAKAISAKGVTTDSDASFDVMATNIGYIETSGGSTNSNTVYELTYTYANNDSETTSGVLMVLALLYPDSSGEITVNGTTLTKTVDNIPTVVTYSMTVDLSYGSNVFTIISPNEDVGITAAYIALSTTYGIPALTSDETTVDGLTYKTSASSVYESFPDCKAYMPFNGTDNLNTVDCWHPDYGEPQWLKLELPYPAIIEQFTMKNRSDYIECPKNVILQGSNNDDEYYDIISFVFSSTGTKGVTKTVETGCTTPYKYYRWYIVEANNYAVISKITIDRMSKLPNDITYLQKLS